MSRVNSYFAPEVVRAIYISILIAYGGMILSAFLLKFLLEKYNKIKNRIVLNLVSSLLGPLIFGSVLWPVLNGSKPLLPNSYNIIAYLILGGVLFVIFFVIDVIRKKIKPSVH